MMICILFQGSVYILTIGLFVDKGLFKLRGEKVHHFLVLDTRLNKFFPGRNVAVIKSRISQKSLGLQAPFFASFHIHALIKLLLAKLLVFDSPGHLSVRVDVHLVENPLSAVFCTLLIANNSCCLEIIGSETNINQVL